MYFSINIHKVWHLYWATFKETNIVPWLLLYLCYSDLFSCTIWISRSILVLQETNSLIWAPPLRVFFQYKFLNLRSTLERVPSECPGPLHRDPTPCAPLGEVFEKCCVSYLASQIGRKTGATGHLRVLCAVMLKYLRHLLINPLIAAAIPGGLWDHGFEQKLSGGNPILLTLSFKYAVFVLARRLTKRAHTCVYAHTRSHIQTLKKNI